MSSEVNRKHIQAIGMPYKLQILLQTEEYSMESTIKSQMCYITADAEAAYLGIDFLLTEPEPPEKGVLVSFRSRTTRSSSSNTI